MPVDQFSHRHTDMKQQRRPNGKQDDWRLLPKQIASFFTFAELDLLCFELDVNPQALGRNNTIEQQALELVRYMQRHNSLPRLLDTLRRHRPNVEWPNIPDSLESTGSTEDQIEDGDDSNSWRGIFGSPYRAVFVSAAVVIVLIALFGYQRFVDRAAVLPMGEGFNIAVAKFGAAQDTDSAKEAAEQLGDWLYEGIVNEVDDLPESRKFAHRGPDEIGVVAGDDVNSRYRKGAEIAYAHQASILIYGTVHEALPNYQVLLEFFVNDEGFSYGSEIAGPDSLGTPITFTIPLDVPTLNHINGELNGRRDALQHVVLGLSAFQIEEFNLALAEFEWVANDSGWDETDGKEVIYLLLGATHLRLYDAISAPHHLEEAKSYFVKARELNPTYTRNYQGLGAVAFEEAQIIDPATARIIAVDPIRLTEAEGLFLTSLRPTSEHVHPYIVLKANLGLGAIHLLGYEFGLEGYAADQVDAYFQAVISDYEIAGEPDELAWFAANAYAQLGILAGLNQDWQGMIDANRKAIDILDNLNRPPKAWNARYYARIGQAHLALQERDKALDAYKRALSTGGNEISSAEFEEWEQKVIELTTSP